MPDKKENLLRSGLSNIATRGFNAFLEGHDIKEEKGGIAGWLNNRKSDLGDTAKLAFVDAVNDPEVQERGKIYVKETLDETLEGIKSDLPSSLDEAANAINKGVEEDKRSNYQKIRAIIGYDLKDRWYVKLGKGVIARIASFGLPILNIVSARVASNISQRENPEDVNNYKASFQKIYGGLLSRLAPPQTRPANA